MSLAGQPPRDQWQPPLQDNGHRSGTSWGTRIKHLLTKDKGEAKTATKTLSSFWKKINNDWIFNLAAMLAYNLLMSIFPLLAMLLSFFGLFLGGLGSAAKQQFINGLTTGIPGGGGEIVQVALSRLAESSGLFAFISIVVSIWFGSRLFVAIDSCFGVIYRLPPRGFLRENAIAVVMLLIFAVLIPILLGVSAAPSFLSTNVVQRLFGPSTAATVLLSIGGVVAGYVVASALFLAIYTVLPNRPLRVRDAWRGALIGGALLQVYVVGFPFYAAHFLKPDSYGSTAGFAVLILVFFYYFGVILLLGAEINSFWAGQRETATSLPGILYEVQVRGNVAGASGPTAGHPSEDLQADRTGLDLTMTPAEDMLQPPGKKDQDRAREAEAAPQPDEQDTATPTPS